MKEVSTDDFCVCDACPDCQAKVEEVDQMRSVYEAAIAWRKSSMKVSAPEFILLKEAVDEAIPEEVTAMKIRMLEGVCRPWLEHKKSCLHIKNEGRCACGCVEDGRYCMETK